MEKRRLQEQEEQDGEERGLKKYDREENVWKGQYEKEKVLKEKFKKRRILKGIGWKKKGFQKNYGEEKISK